MFFAGTEPWVARRVGEPAVLDEDLAVGYLVAAGIGPDQTVGIAGVHTEVLNWRAIARAVQPDVRRPGRIPSPFPYLPATPQELLVAYLDIVGVEPVDAYSAQVTEDAARDFQHAEDAQHEDRELAFNTRSNTGTKQPCTDGKDRPRLIGGSRVVVVYRDSEAYAKGRARWASYERDVLLAALHHETYLRRPVEAPPSTPYGGGAVGKTLRGAEKVYNAIDPDFRGLDDWDRLAPHRYCWPPTA